MVQRRVFNAVRSASSDHGSEKVILIKVKQNPRGLETLLRKGRLCGNAGGPSDVCK